MVKISEYANKNNLIVNNWGASIETLTTTWSRFDFGIHWMGSSGGVTGTMPEVHLMASDFEFVADLPQGTSEISVVWTAGTNSGTIKESYYGQYDINTSRPTASVTRDNVDPGYGNIKIQDTDSPDAGTPGPRYTFMLSGTEFRIYVNYINLPSLGQRPICVIASPSTGFDFPMTLVMRGRTNFAIRNITASGAVLPSTIYSKREQVEDFGAAQDTLYLRIYQVPLYSAVGQGLPLDLLLVPPVMVLEDGTTELFTEASDTILR